MNVMRTIKVVVVLLALLVGLPTLAFAHAGHEHGQSVGQPSSDVYPLGAETRTQAQHKKASTHFTSSSNHEMTAQSLVSFSSDQRTARCTPGTCCCQGASSCSSGHCCSFGLLSTHAYGMSQREDKNARLALLNWPYPDIIFGLDRPPKV